MKLIATIISFLTILTFTQSFPIIGKRFYQSSSPNFSLIAHHKGKVFQYHLVKYNENELVLNADEQAFFGRIKASNGYVLNIPDYKNSSMISSNSTSNSTVSPPSPTNIEVDDERQLIIADKPTNGSTNFGISKSLLTFKNSTEFLACGDHSYRNEYKIYWNLPHCPDNSTGYDITLLVQGDATINYNEKTNV